MDVARALSAQAAAGSWLAGCARSARSPKETPRRRLALARSRGRRRYAPLAGTVTKLSALNDAMGPSLAGRRSARSSASRRPVTPLRPHH